MLDTGANELFIKWASSKEKSISVKLRAYDELIDGVNNVNIEPGNKAAKFMMLTLNAEEYRIYRGKYLLEIVIVHNGEKTQGNDAVVITIINQFKEYVPYGE